MQHNQISELLKQVADGTTSIPEAKEHIETFYFEDIGYAHVDHHRSIRKGFCEVIFGQGKTAEQIIGIMEKMAGREAVILATRMDAQKAESVLEQFENARYHQEAGLVELRTYEPDITGNGDILVISAGTSDIPVAQEAVITARAMGNRAETVYDVGVAGIHRLFAHKELIDNASVIIAVAGMEGALPSVVAGMVGAPVIAVPTSVGYGTSLNGLTALFGMLNSCSSNIAVVNIDNGFGAGYMASAINHT